MPKKMDKATDVDKSVEDGGNLQPVDPNEAEPDPNDPREPDPDKLAVDTMMAEEGISFQEAVTRLQIIKNVAARPEPSGGDRVTASEVLAAHEPKIPVVDPPPEREDFVVSLLPRHANWIKAMAHWESIRRKQKIPLGRMIEQIIREAYAADPTKGGVVTGGGTGKAADFRPEGGDWET